MNRSPVRPLFAVLLLVLGISATAHAQLPVNNDAWKTRCNLLASQASAIQNGNAPALLVTATRNVASKPFLVLAVNRADAEQHFVSCAMYYMASISAFRSHDASDGADYAVLADAEFRDATGQSVTFSEHMKRMKFKASNLTSSLTSSPAETQAAIDAAGTMPLSLTLPVTRAEVSYPKR